MPDFYQTGDYRPELPEPRLANTERNTPETNIVRHPEPKTADSTKEHIMCSTGKAIVELERSIQWLERLGMKRLVKAFKSIVDQLDEHSDTICPPAKKHSNKPKGKPKDDQ